MEEIDLSELLEFVKSKIAMIILITATACVLGGLYAMFLQTPLYKSSATIVLANTTSSESSITQNDVTLNQKLVSTYSEIAKSRTVLDTVIDSLGLDVQYDELASKVSVTSVTNTEIIKISTLDKNAKVAQEITNSIAKVFSEEVASIYNMKNVKILDEASIEDTPDNINIPKQLIIYFMIGLVISLAITFIQFYFDNTVKSVEQVEVKLGLPILGRIPVHGKEK